MKKLLLAIFIPVSILFLMFLMIYLVVYIKYDINLFNAIGHLKTINEVVDENKLCPNAFDSSDMVDVKSIVNESVEEMITYTEENGYVVNFDDLPEEMKYIIKLNDKQVGALTQTIIEQEMDSKIRLGGKDIEITIMQVDFSNIEDSNATVNIVVKIDVTPIKNDLNGAYTLIENFIPDYFYVSSTVDVEKEGPFTYTVTHNSLTINNLTKEDTEDLFRTLDAILKIGKLEDLNVQLGEAALGALVGSEEKNGIAYSLKDIGATGYDFIVKDGFDYFVVTR